MLTLTWSPNQHRLYRLVLLCVAVVLTANTLLCAYLFSQHQHRQQENHAREYGTALAQIAARQAVDPTLTNDLVSLQVILKEVATNPQVAGATIHDVENRLLVQGGHLPQGGNNRMQRSFSAPITLHNSIAGYVTVTLTLNGESQGNLYGQLFWAWAALLLLIAAAVAFWLNREDATEDATPEQVIPTDPKTTNSAVPESEPPASTPQVPETKTESRPSVSLHLKIHNFAQLHDQLNRGSFKSLISRFEQQLVGVHTLYGGRLDRPGVTGRDLNLDYAGNSLDDCSFRALCSAQLLLSLTTQVQGPQLQLSASLSSRECGDDNDTPLWDQMLAAGINPQLPGPHQVYIAPELLSATLARQVDYTALPDGQGARLEQIRSPYDELLTRQERQLIAL